MIYNFETRHDKQTTVYVLFILVLAKQKYVFFYVHYTDLRAASCECFWVDIEAVWVVVSAVDNLQHTHDVMQLLTSCYSLKLNRKWQQITEARSCLNVPRKASFVSSLGTCDS